MIEKFDDYQAETQKTVKPDLLENNQELLKYLCMKLSEETGEVIGPIAKHLYHGKPLDKKAVAEEIGDATWYLSNLAAALGFSLSQIATWNIEKLRERHGESYRAEFYSTPSNKI